MPRRRGPAAAGDPGVPERGFLAKSGNFHWDVRGRLAGRARRLFLEKDSKVSNWQRDLETRGLALSRGDDGTACVPRLEYKYSKLVMDAAARETDATSPDSCAIMEGEDAEDELLFATEMSLFGKLKALTTKVRGGVGGGNNPGVATGQAVVEMDLRMVHVSIPHPGEGSVSQFSHSKGGSVPQFPIPGGSGPQFPYPTADAGWIRLGPAQDLIQQYRSGAVRGRGAPSHPAALPGVVTGQRGTHGNPGPGQL